MELGVGDIVDGKVTGITKFGAFVQIPGNQVGLVHISEVSHGYVKDINDFLKTDDEIKVKIMKMDAGKISLSLKAVSPAPVSASEGNFSQRNNAAEIEQKKETRKEPQSFEEMMKKFMQDSNERQGEVKRNREAKRGFR